MWVSEYWLYAPRPIAQGRRQGFRLEDGSYESLPVKYPKSQNPWNSLSRQSRQRSGPLRTVILGPRAYPNMDQS